MYGEPDNLTKYKRKLVNMETEVTIKGSVYHDSVAKKGFDVMRETVTAKNHRWKRHGHIVCRKALIAPTRNSRHINDWHTCVDDD
jgi:hypothetical protein